MHKKCKKEAVTQPLNVKDWIRALTDEFPHLGSERARYRSNFLGDVDDFHNEQDR